MDSNAPPSFPNPAGLFTAARKRGDLTQPELAELIGTDAHWVSKRETGAVSYSLHDAQRLSFLLTDDEWASLRPSAPKNDAG